LRFDDKAERERLERQQREQAEAVNGIPSETYFDEHQTYRVARQSRIASILAFPMLMNTPSLQQERPRKKVGRWSAGLTWKLLRPGCLAGRVEKGTNGSYHLQFWLATETAWQQNRPRLYICQG
jgi:hypothetical protein